MKVSGIYQIRNTINNHIYIGSSSNIKSRFFNHKSRLNKGTHANPYLQSAWNLYKEENFEFKVLLICSMDKLIWYEQQLINKWKPKYNINILANKPNPRIYTDEQRIKVSTEHKNKCVSEETRMKISKARTGMKFSEETKIKLSKSHLGHKPSEETRKKMSISQKGKKMSEESRIKMSLAQVERFKKEKQHAS